MPASAQTETLLSDAKFRRDRSEVRPWKRDKNLLWHHPPCPRHLRPLAVTSQGRRNVCRPCTCRKTSLCRKDIRRSSIRDGWSAQSSPAVCTSAPSCGLSFQLWASVYSCGLPLIPLPHPWSASRWFPDIRPRTSGWRWRPLRHILTCFVALRSGAALWVSDAQKRGNPGRRKRRFRINFQDPWINLVKEAKESFLPTGIWSYKKYSAWTQALLFLALIRSIALWITIP